MRLYQRMTMFALTAVLGLGGLSGFGTSSAQAQGFAPGEYYPPPRHRPSYPPYWVQRPYFPPYWGWGGAGGGSGGGYGGHNGGHGGGYGGHNGGHGGGYGGHGGGNG